MMHTSLLHLVVGSCIEDADVLGLVLYDGEFPDVL